MKQYSPMEVREAGKDTEARAVLSRKALSPIVWSVDGKEKEIKEDSRNASEPMCVTLVAERSTEVRAEFLKAML